MKGETKNKVGTIGLGQVGTFENFILQSEAPMADFKLLVWKPTGKDNLWEWSSRQVDFAQYFDRGGNLILFLEKGSEFRYALPPDFPIFTQKLTGFALEIVEGPLAKILNPYLKEKPKYSVVLNVTKGTFTPVAYTPGNQKNVSLWIQYRNGFVFVLPFDSDKSESAMLLIPRIDNFLGAQKKKIHHQLGSLPGWASKYQFLEELKAVRLRDALQKDLLRIQNEIPAVEDTIQSFGKYLHLFSEEGRSLDGLVRSIFGEIGFTVSDGPDLNSYGVLQYGKKVAIVFTKALTGTATDKDARQVEVWKSHYESYVNQLPKGILVLNCQKEMDLFDRNQAPFSDQLISYAEATDICVMTTTQLVGMLMDLKGHPQNQDRLIQALLETKGPIRGYAEMMKYVVPRKTA